MNFHKLELKTIGIFLIEYEANLRMVGSIFNFASVERNKIKRTNLYIYWN